MAEKILIIDDDLDTANLVSMMFQRLGYKTATANDGLQGLVKMSEEIPDLILLDVMMPDMDGFEVARRLRNNPETTQIPILMFTAKSQVNDKITGFDAGADDYLTKPTHPSELQAHVKALLERSVKSEVEQTSPQLTRSKKTKTKQTARQDKRAPTDDKVSTRFSTWFGNAPSNEVKK